MNLYETTFSEIEMSFKYFNVTKIIDKMKQSSLTIE